MLLSGAASLGRAEPATSQNSIYFELKVPFIFLTRILHTFRCFYLLQTFCNTNNVYKYHAFKWTDIRKIITSAI